MESTLKISTSGRGVHGVPVIKIVQPVHLVNPDPTLDIDDVRDELLSSLLHTPCMQYPNLLFKVDAHFITPSDNHTHRTTIISAIEEGQVFHTFKHAILERLISYDNLVEINILEKSLKTLEMSHPTEQNTRKCPVDYDKYLKIKEFFDWVWNQPYNGDPINTPIETRRDTPVKQGTINHLPMKTINDYFEMALEQDERINAFENTPKNKLNKKVENIWDAIHSAFNPDDTPQGVEYWQKIINRIG